MRLIRVLAAASYLALLALVLAWELWGAAVTPLPRGFWMALKGLPLLLPLYGIFRGSPRAHVLAALLVLLYFSEGIATAWTERHRTVALAYGMAEVLLATVFIVSASFYARFRWQAAPPRANAGTGS